MQMPREIVPRAQMPKQRSEVRRHNFDEVALGLTPEQARREAQRCLKCKTRPCVAGCPVEVPIPEFLALAAEGKFEEADAKIKRRTVSQLYVEGYARRRPSASRCAC